MARHTPCFVTLLQLVLATFLARSYAQEACTDFTISHSCPQPSESTCTTLQESLQEVASWDPVSPPHDCVDLNLSPGEHVLSSPVAINGTAIWLRLHGSGDLSTSIRCAESINYTGNHSILLERVEGVVLESVFVYGCKRPIRIANSRNVSILLSLFSLFTTGALDVYNCLQVQLFDSIFTNNTARAQIQDAPFRGNSGGISIGIHDVQSNISTVYFTVRNCTFIGNKAEPDVVDVVSTTRLYQQELFTGRGGGLGIFIQNNISVSATVEDCYFQQNNATSLGGGLYFILNGLVSNHSVRVSRSKFINNSAQVGGGMNVGYLLISIAATVHTVEVTNCTFINNQASYGGATYIFPSIRGARGGVSVKFRNCTFTKNSASTYGAALGLLSVDFFEPFDLFSPYIVEDCKFYNNSGSTSGILDVTYSPLRMIGYNIFQNNIGPSLRVTGAEMTVSGRLDFIDNDAENSDGGALYITSYGQVVMQRGSEMNFIGNNGSLGGAIVVESQNIGNRRLKINNTVNELTTALTAFNPLCFLRYGSNDSLSPLQWEEVSINFSRNAAIIGPATFINQLDLCSWTRNTLYSSYNRSGVMRWPFVHFEDDNLNLGHPPSQVNNSAYYVQTPPVVVDISNTEILASPGQRIEITADTTDELGNPTGVFIRINDLLMSKTTQLPPTSTQYSVSTNVQYTFQPHILIFTPKQNKAATTYEVNADDFTTTSTLVFSTSSFTTERIKVHIPFTAQICPPGYLLQVNISTPGNSTKACICNTANNPYLLECESDRETLILIPNIWTLVTMNSTGGSFELRSYSCPFEDCRIISIGVGESTYGSIFNHNNPDLQCACNRSGVLCGSCPAGYGVSALQNRCITCSNANALLLVALVVVDILICIGIVLTSSRLPVWLYPCLFYMQIFPYITEGFPITFGTVRRFVYYISSALSLYLPYDFCLYEDMSPLVSYFFRYLPLITVIPTAIVTLVIKHRKRPTKWYGIWTLVILMYTQVVHTSMTFLNCPVIGHHGSRWYINGNIKCFKDAHGVLAVLAIVILLLAVIIIPLIALPTSWKKPKRKIEWLKFVIPPLSYAFKDKFKWWGSVELSRRFLLLLFTVAFPGNIAQTYLLMISATVYLFVQPYKSLFANRLEAMLSVNSLVLFLIASDLAITEGLSTASSLPLDEVGIFKPGSSSCPDLNRGVMGLTAFLVPFYFLPLLILIMGIGLMAVKLLRTEGKSVIQRGKELYEQWKTSKSLEDTYVLYEAKELDETIRSKNFKSTFVSIAE